MREADGTSQAARLARELADLLDLGYSLREALGKLAAGFPGAFARRLREVARAMDQGGTLATELERNPGPFPRLFVRAVAVGEHAQSLPVALRRVSDLLEEAQRRRMAVSLALAYPQAVMAAMVVLGGLLFGWILPVFQRLVGGMSLALPPDTRIVFGLEFLLTRPWFLTLLAVTFVGAWSLLSGWGLWDGVRLRVPVLGAWLARHQAVILLRWLDYFTGLGLPVDEATGLAAEACSPGFRAAMQPAVSSLERGGCLSEALASVRIFPPLGAWLAHQAEQRDFPPGALDRAADTIHRELEMTEGRTVAALEPLMIVVLGLVIGFVVSSVFLPLYQLIGNLGS